MLIAALFIATTAAVYFYNESEYRRQQYYQLKVKELRAR